MPSPQPRKNARIADANLASPRVPSIRDVAAAAQVNMSTVSRFLNGRAALLPETARRIRAAVDDLGYQVVPEHRRKGNRLNTRRRENVETICLLLGGKFDLRWIADHSVAYAYLLDGVRHAAKAAGIDLLLRHAADPAELQSVLRSPGVHGLLVLGDDPPLSSAGEAVRLRPLVKLLGDTFSHLWDTVTYSNIESGRIAARYLLEKHVRTAAILSAPARRGLFAIRSLVFRSEMEAAGAEVVDLPAVKFNDLSDVGDWDAAREMGDFVEKLRACRPKVEGLFVTQDHQLRLLWPALQRHGIEPCRELHIIGCNNELPHLRSLFPRPASIDIRCEDIGRVGVQQLLARIKNPAEPARAILLPPTLVRSQYEN